MNFLLAAATLARALALPPHATVEPFSPRAAIAVARDGTVAATVTLGGYSRRALVWNATGGWHAIRVPALDPGSDAIDTSVAAFDRTNALLANVAASYSDAPVRHVAYRGVRVAGSNVTAFDFGACGDPQRSQGPELGGIYADGDLVATMQSPPIVDLGDQSGQLAPVAVRLRGKVCTYLGNGNVFAAAGQYAAGYAGYVGNAAQSPSVVVAGQRYVALRWHGDERSELGAGAALAVNAAGAAAGADAPPGLGETFGIVPHARYWSAPGQGVDLAPGPSVAYAIDDRDRIAGMLIDGNGRHRAFLYAGGKLQLLDDLVNAPGWRFESAYAFAPDGEIAGIGVHQNRAEIFLVFVP